MAVHAAYGFWLYYLRVHVFCRPTLPFATEAAIGQARALRRPLLLPTRPRAKMGAKRKKREH